MEKKVKFVSELPDFKLVDLPECNASSIFGKYSAACSQRNYKLNQDWLLEISHYKLEKLNGIVKVPAQYKGEQQYFDGASIPMPWLFSALTFGIARPMGVMLVPSVPHDFAYNHGVLFVSKDGGNTFEEVEVSRSEIDMLLRDMLKFIIGLPIMSYAGWMVVRLGWWFLPYAGKKRDGKPPYKEVWPLVVATVLILGCLITAVEPFLVLVAMAYMYFWNRFSKNPNH